MGNIWSNEGKKGKLRNDHPDLQVVSAGPVGPPTSDGFAQSTGSWDSSTRRALPPRRQPTSISLRTPFPLSRSAEGEGRPPSSQNEGVKGEVGKLARELGNSSPSQGRRRTSGSYPLKNTRIIHHVLTIPRHWFIEAAMNTIYRAEVLGNAGYFHHFVMISCCIKPSCRYAETNQPPCRYVEILM